MKTSSIDEDQLPTRHQHLAAGMLRSDLIEPKNISEDEALLRRGLDSADALEPAQYSRRTRPTSSPASSV